jgi:hypothetical protein
MRLRIAVAAVLTFAFLANPPHPHTLFGQQLSTAEKEIQTRRLAQNGIAVGEPKLYDDALLQQMLVAAQAKLASLQLVDQAQIAAKVGSQSGADQRVDSGALSVQTPPLPSVKTTEKGPTSLITRPMGRRPPGRRPTWQPPRGRPTSRPSVLPSLRLRRRQRPGRSRCRRASQFRPRMCSTNRCS